MHYRTWLRRLADRLPGWQVWVSSPGPKWNAVPAPADIGHTEALHLPGRVHAATPQLLRQLCRERYGWDDICGTCNVLARECGHRQPETKERGHAQHHQR